VAVATSTSEQAKASPKTASEGEAAARTSASSGKQSLTKDTRTDG